MSGTLARSQLLRTFTLLSKNPEPILAYLSGLAAPIRDSVAFFSLSSNADRLESIVTELQNISDQHVGCLSAPLPGAPSDVVCSVAVFTRDLCKVVRSTIPGRKQAQVGRWSLAKRDNEPPPVDEAPLLPTDGDWAKVWQQGNRPNHAPLELAGLDDAQAFLFFTDNAPEGLISALDLQLPRSVAKFGLIASSTPFVTGRPYTLFHNSQIVSSGAVALAVRGDMKPQTSVSFDGFIEMAPPLRVSEAQGNLIHKLNNTNPTRLLLAAIDSLHRSQGKAEPAESVFVTKEEQFHLGVPYSLDDTSEARTYQRVYRITSGDPSRGTMSLDGDDGPRSGTYVQFLRRAESPPLLDLPTQSPSPLFQFHSTSDDIGSSNHAASRLSGGDDGDIRVLEGVFLAASEHGFVTSVLPGMPLGRGRCWRSSVIGGRVEMGFGYPG